MNIDYKTIGKYGLLTAGGLAAAATSYFLYKYVEKKIKDKEAEAEQLEIDWVKGVEIAESYSQTSEDVVVDESALDEEPLENSEKPLSPIEAAKKMKKEKTQVQITDYAALSRKLMKSPLKDIAKEHLGEEAVEETEQDSNDPTVITMEEYYVANSKGFEKMVLTYYEKDDVLCDPNNEVVPVPEALLGPDGLLKFGNGSGDPDTVYIRNPLTSTVYEVVMLHKSYQTEVLGVKPERKRGKTRKVTKIDDDQDGEE